MNKPQKFETWSDGAFNIFKVTVETSGKKGGDKSHGGYSSVEVFVDSMTCIDVEVTPWHGQGEGRGPAPVPFEFVNGFKVTFRGDAEIESFAKALRFAADSLQFAALVDPREEIE